MNRRRREDEHLPRNPCSQELVRERDWAAVGLPTPPVHRGAWAAERHPAVARCTTRARAGSFCTVIAIRFTMPRKRSVTCPENGYDITVSRYLGRLEFMFYATAITYPPHILIGTYSLFRPTLTFGRVVHCRYAVDPVWSAQGADRRLG